MDHANQLPSESTPPAPGRISSFPGFAAAAGDLTFLVRSDGLIIDYATYYPEYLYVPPDQFLNRRLQEVLPVDIAERAMAALEAAQRTGLVQSLVYSNPAHSYVGDAFFEARVSSCGDGTFAIVIRDVTEHRKVDLLVRRQNVMLAAITKALSRAISHEHPRAIFEDLLVDMIALTESEFGFVASLEQDPNGLPFLRTLAITDVSWDEDTRQHFDLSKASGMEFRNFASLFGATVTSREVIISRNPESDPRRGGTPPGHPKLSTYMGMPIFNGTELVGMAGVANRSLEYEQADAEGLIPLLNACGHMIAAMRAEARQSQAEQLLRASEERFQLAVMGSNDGIWDFNLKDKSPWLSPRLYSLLHYSDREIPASYREFRRHLHPHERRSVLDRVRSFLRSGKPYQDEFRLRTRDGEFRWYSARGLAVLDADRRPIRFAGALQDVTERVRVEQALLNARDELEERVRSRTAELSAANSRLQREILERTRVSDEREQLIAIVEATTDFVGLVHVDGTLRYLNRSYRKALGIGDDEDVSQLKFSDFLTFWSREITANDAWPTAIGEGTWSGEIVVVSRSGREIPTSNVMHSHRSATDEVQIISMIARDSGESRRVEQLQHELAHMNRVSTANAMASALAHELNQPLGAIANDARACQRGMIEGRLSRDEVREALEAIASAAIRGGEIMRRIRAFVGKRPNRKQGTRLNDLVLDVCRMMQSEARRKNIVFALELANDLPEVTVDSVQIEQVLLNLVRNALDAIEQFAPSIRRIVVSTVLDQDSVHVSVVDFAVPTPDDFPKSAFDPYFTTKEDGLGMGLAISRSIVESYEGILVATPNTGRGMTFRFSIPVTSRLDG